MRRASQSVLSVIEPVVTGLGFEFVGAEFGQAENGMTLRVYIDTERKEGIVIEDCVAVSRELDAVMEVEDPIGQAYQLEVSSPGVDRPLFNEAHFSAQIGQEVRIRLASGIGGRRNYKGVLLAVADGHVTVEVDNVDHAVPLDDMEQAYLIGRLP